MHKLYYSKYAIKDVDDILFYISNNLNNPTAAKKLKQEIMKGENVILTFPHGVLKYKKKLNYYIQKVKNYYMIYTIDEDNKIIIVVRVLYKKRNINLFLKEN